MIAIERLLHETRKSLFYLVVLGLVLLFSGGEALAQQPASPTPSQTAPVGERGKAMLFKHPKLGYLVAIPPGAIVEHRDEVSGIAMKSRKGYLITLQTAAARTGTPLPELMSRLEQRYLGNGRPWSRKLGEQPTRVAGLNAFEAMYEGAGSKVRVVVTRGVRLDYAFIFIAPPQEFNKLVTDFNWVLQSFRPAQGGAGEGASDPASDGLDEMMAGKVRNFVDGGLGFAIDYPLSWVAERANGPYVVISGRKGTPAYFATINIQNVRPADSGVDITQATQGVVTVLKRQLKQADNNVRFPGQGPFVYSGGGLTLHGLQFTVEYEREKQAFRQWSVVLARPDNGIVHVWSYAAPQDRYDRYGAIAGKMLESWKISLQ
jgi:hypothetical protein